MKAAVAATAGLATAGAGLEVRNLDVGYGPLGEVLRGLSLTVAPGQIVTLLGPNGAGKTTLMRAVMGLLGLHDGEVRRGEILLDGVDCTSAESSQIVRRGIGLVPEGRQVFPTLSVEDNLRSGAHTRRGNRAEVEATFESMLERFPVLADRRRQAAGLLSGGEQQMVAMARALMAKPRLLLMDEPSLGLAPRIVEQIRDVIVEVRAEGTSVLLVEQNAALALEIADYGYVMETGRIVLDGPAKELLANTEIREFYLGQTGGERRNYRDVKHYRRRKRWLS
ncbi:MAG: ABC transporter ATP-binding protein [Ilumatobacteraceae bacterium]